MAGSSLDPGLFRLARRLAEAEARLAAAEAREVFLRRAVAVLAQLVGEVAPPGSAARVAAEAVRRSALAGRPVWGP